MEIAHPEHAPATRGTEDERITELVTDGWITVQTVVDAHTHPVLVLDHDLCVVAANTHYYQGFSVTPEEIRGARLFALHEGLWDTQRFRDHLSCVVGDGTYSEGLQESGVVPRVGKRVMFVRAHHIHFVDRTTRKALVLVTFEDMTEIMEVADMLATQAHTVIDTTVNARTEHLEAMVRSLQTEVRNLEKRVNTQESVHRMVS